MMTRLAGIRADYENERRDLLGLFLPGGLMDLVRADINDEAADAMSVQLRDTVHDLDRRLGRRPTDLSGRYPTSEENPFNLVL